MSEDAPFDARAALDELTRLAPAVHGRKLNQTMQCAAYAALWNGMSNKIVAEVFNLSLTSVSNLAGCRNDLRTETIIEVGDYSETHPSPSLTKRKYRARKARYLAVAREWDRLGADEFIRFYFTPQIAARIRNAMRENGLIK
jgi:hypothetical protein